MTKPSPDEHRIHTALQNPAEAHRDALLGHAEAFFGRLDAARVQGTDIARVVILDAIRRAAL